MTDPTFAPVSTGTLSGLLRSLAAIQPERGALVYPAFAHAGREIRLTFAALDARVDDLAKGLVADGIERGDHVAVWGSNVPDWIPLEFALARIGAVMVTVNTALKRDEVAYVLQQSKAVAVIHTSRTGTNDASAILDDLFTSGDPSVRLIRRRIWMPSAPGDAPPATVATIDAVCLEGRAVSDEALARREHRCAPDDVVNIQYTSGTTGFPKGVMLSHANLFHSGFAIGDELRMTPDDRVAVIVPLFHCFGCVVAVLGAYTHGAGLAVIPAFEPEAALRLVHEERCTVIHGVPTMFGAMLEHPTRARYDTSCLRTGLAAGSPVPEPLMRRIVDELHCAGMCIAYGLTEASPAVAGTVPEDDFGARCGTIGRELPGVEVRIVDAESGARVPDGERGELQVRGPNIMVGYHDEPEATAAAVTPEGWLRTGDQAVRGADGLLRIVGRIKDLIIRGGENIAPAEIESVLREHPDIVDAAVVGLPDEHFGEQVAAALILRDGCDLDPPSYEALLQERVAKFKVPKAWYRLEGFPLTGSGKVRKFLLRERLTRVEDLP